MNRAITLIPLVILLMGAAAIIEYPDASIPSSALKTTGVPAGTTGDATHTNAVTVNLQGQVTNISSIAIAAMTGASSGAPGTSGFVGAPAAGQQGYFWRGDATWQPVSGTGTVTSVGSTGTLTGGPVTTSGNLDIDLTHANDWTGRQRYAAGTGGETGPAVIAIRADSTQTASTTGGTTTGTNISLAGNTLTTAGQKMRIVADWMHANNTNSATLSVVFGPGGGTTLCQAINAVANATPQITLTVTVLTVGAGATSSYTYHCSNESAAYSASGGIVTSVNLGSVLVLKTTTGPTTLSADATTAGATVEVIGS